MTQRRPGSCRLLAFLCNREDANPASVIGNTCAEYSIADWNLKLTILPKRILSLRAMAIVSLLASLLTVSCSSESPGSADTTGGPPAMTDVGAPAGAITTGDIGPEGGQLVSSDGLLTIVVPPGAVAAPTRFGVQPIDNLAPGGVGAGYRLTPDGQTFAVPLRLEFVYRDAELLGSALPALGIVYQNPQRQWRSVRAVARDAANHRVSVTTTHFTDWVRALEFRIEPPAASIEPGQAVGLQLFECRRLEVPVGPGEDSLSELVETCLPGRAQLTWSANGVPGGDGANGTVVGFAGGASYTAPSSTPAQNPVAVSAEETASDGSKFLLVSNVDVGGKGVWTGTSTFAADGDTTMGSTRSTYRQRTQAQVTFQWKEEAQTYVPQGNVSFEVTGTLATPEKSCTTTTQYAAAVRFQDGQLRVEQDGSYFGSGGSYDAMVTETEVCTFPDAPTKTDTRTVPTVIVWWQGAGQVSADGRVIEGTGTYPQGMFTAATSWRFTKQ